MTEAWIESVDGFTGEKKENTTEKKKPKTPVLGLRL